MGQLTIYSDTCHDATIVSNRFLDEYMKDANDAQLKVYLYLLRVMSANLPVSISDIADKFNHTEKDVIRSLEYWEKMHLLTLDYDEQKNIAGIHLKDIASANQAQIVPKTESAVMKKPTYSASDLENFSTNPDVAQILFIAETYLGKALSETEVKTFLFIYDVLDFSAELMDYLIEYCVGKGKKDIRYIEKVALDWAANDVKTVRQAQLRANKYDKTVYAVLRALGKNSMATDTEAAYISKWLNKYAFAPEIILYACEKTVLATDSHRLEYADGILSRWLSQGIKTKEQIKSSEQKYKQSKNPVQKTGAPNNKFNDFTQNSYDFASLEQELLSN